MLENSFIAAVKLVKHADIDKYKYSENGLAFDTKRNFFMSYWWI